MAITAIIKALTVKSERILLNHNYRFMLGDEIEVSSTSESELEGYQVNHINSEF